MYGLKSEDDRSNQMWDVDQVNSVFGSKIDAYNTDDDQFYGFTGPYSIESHHCSGEYIQADMSPVGIQFESQSEFKSSAFKIELLN